VFEALARKHSHVRFGSVNIDDAAGMQLAVQSGALEEGVPSVRAFKRKSDSAGELVWAGDDAPALAVLEAALGRVVPMTAHTRRLRKEA